MKKNGKEKVQKKIDHHEEYSVRKLHVWSCIALRTPAPEESRTSLRHCAVLMNCYVVLRVTTRKLTARLFTWVERHLCIGSGW
jgi:hypothetical protein